MTTTGSSLSGLGLTMEAIEQNPVVYEFTTELMWLDNPTDINTKEWIHKYVNIYYFKGTKKSWC